MAGTLIRYQVVNDFIVKGQLLSLGLSLLLVFLMVATLFFRRYRDRSFGARVVRSLTAGALTLVPILVAVATNFGVMALADIPLEIGTVLIAACAVGIGIDYSVHFLHRYEARLVDGHGVEDAIRGAARSSGRPIVFNAAAVSAGFLTLLFSDFLSLRHMAVLTTLTMLVTSLAALTLLPAFLTLRDRSKL